MSPHRINVSAPIHFLGKVKQEKSSLTPKIKSELVSYEVAHQLSF